MRYHSRQAVLIAIPNVVLLSYYPSPFLSGGPFKPGFGLCGAVLAEHNFAAARSRFRASIPIPFRLVFPASRLSS